MEAKTAMPEKKEKKPAKVSGEEDRKTGDKPADEEKSQKLKDTKDAMDKVLDEIDDFLNEEGQEFINSYVQRGGE